MKGVLILLGVVALGVGAGLIFMGLSRSGKNPPEVPRPPKVAVWDGASFLTKEDARAMGADMSSPSPVFYRKEGHAHFYQLGLGELEAQVWAYADTPGAQQRYDKERSDDRIACETALRKSTASVAEVKELDGGYLKSMIRSDGWGVAVHVARRGAFVVKVMRAEKVSNAKELEGVVQRGRKAFEYVAGKLR